MAKNEDWQELCRQAAVERDPDRLLELTRRINEILLAKEETLRRGRRRAHSVPANSTERENDGN